MRIAFVNQPMDCVSPPSPTSIGIFTWELARRLSESNEVIIYEKKRPGRSGMEKDGNLVFCRFSVNHHQWMARLIHRFLRRRRKNFPVFSSGFYYLNYILHVAQDIRSRKCDIVHIHNFSQFVPVVRTLDPEVKIVLHMHCEWLSQLESEIIRSRLRKTDLILGCSGFITDRIRYSFPSFSDKCGVVYNGVDVRHFMPLPMDIRERDPETRTLFFLGRISPEKGLHILLEAFREVLLVYPKTRLEIAGPKIQAPADFIINLSHEQEIRDLIRFYQKGDTERYIRFLDSEIQSNHISGQVTFLNSLPHAEIVKRYRHADIFVLPSVGNEPFGIPVIEAMACEVPVVAFAVGGVNEIIENEKSGLLVEQGDARGMARAILRLMKDDQFRQSIARAGRQRAADIFSWDRIAEELKVHYEKVLHC